MKEEPTALHLKTSTRHRPRRTMSSNASRFSRQGYKPVRMPSTTTATTSVGPSYYTEPAWGSEVGPESESSEDDEIMSFDSQNHDQITDYQMNDEPAAAWQVQSSSNRHRQSMYSNNSRFSRQGYKFVRTPSTTPRAGPSYYSEADVLVNELRLLTEEAELSGNLMSQQYHNEAGSILQELEQLGTIEYIQPSLSNHFKPSLCGYRLV